MVYENIEIIDAGSEGMAIGKIDQKVIFVPFVVPGDIIDVQVTRKKKSFLEGKAVKIHHFSEKRIEPHCSHFGICGGCRWQNMKYEEQLFYKQKQVTDSFERIGKLKNPNILPILASPKTRYYRNKLDFTFSNHRWLTDADRDRESGSVDTNALGFHIPTFFDKVVDISECFHQPSPSNEIRLAVKKYALDHHLSFYDVRRWEGFLRNLIIRNTLAGGLMVILVVHDHDNKVIRDIMDFISSSFPQITSLYYVVNPKKNDTLFDLDFHLFKGEPVITEKMSPLQPGGKEILFRIGPASFFQTNSQQAEALYRISAGFAEFTGEETVYDLYTGTGTIANLIAPSVDRVVGIDSVAAAIADAEINAQINGISNTIFFAGEAEKLLTPEFIHSQGTPDLIMTDPPRNGMHEKVVRAILEVLPEKVIYISCNPATQARDIALMSDKYHLEKSQPVDMFPHTQHVENVCLLKRTNESGGTKG